MQVIEMAMDEQLKLDIFVNVSAFLTGFDRVDLLGTGMAFDYFNHVEQNVGEERFNKLLERMEVIRFHQDDTLYQSIRVNHFSDPEFGPILRAMIKLWYLGQWEGMPDWWVKQFSAPEQNNIIVSPKAYIEGLVWPAIGSHPMGAKQPGFGTWSRPPKPQQS